MSFRLAARVDDNQTEIVKAYRKMGCSVLITSQLKECCDLFVSKSLKTMAVEVKDGSKPPSARKLSEGEKLFKESWKGIYIVVESVDDAIRSVEFLNKF